MGDFPFGFKMEMDCSIEGSGYKGGHESSNNGEINDKELPIDLRPRIRWTNRLHEIFVDAVQLLGGSQYATPKNIVREMGVQGLTVRHVKSHLQKYRRHQKQASTKGHGAPLIHATGYGSSSNQIEVGTFGPVIPMQTATDLGGQFVEPVITPCIETQNWNSTMMPTPTHQRDNSSNPTIPQNEMQSLPLHEEIQMHLLTPPAAEEQRYKSLLKVAGSTNMMAPAHGSSSDPGLQTPEEDSTASDESFLDLDDWPC